MIAKEVKKLLPSDWPLTIGDLPSPNVESVCLIEFDGYYNTQYFGRGYGTMMGHPLIKVVGRSKSYETAEFWMDEAKRRLNRYIGEDDEESGVVYQTVTLTAMRNRITVRPKRALLNRNQAQVESYLTNQNNDAFNSAMLVFPYSENESIVVGPGSYTVVVNIDDQDGNPDFMIMSSF